MLTDAVVLASVEVAGFAGQVAVHRDLVGVRVRHVERVTGCFQVLNRLIRGFSVAVHFPANTTSTKSASQDHDISEELVFSFSEEHMQKKNMY